MSELASTEKALNDSELSLVREQLDLFRSEEAVPESEKKATFSDPAFAKNKTHPIHRWVPWVAGYSSDFVRDVVTSRVSRPGTVLDPFRRRRHNPG